MKRAQGLGAELSAAVRAWKVQACSAPPGGGEGMLGRSRTRAAWLPELVSLQPLRASGLRLLFCMDRKQFVKAAQGKMQGVEI